MNLFKRIFDALIYSNLYVSLAAALLVIETNLLFDFENTGYSLAFFVFFATLATYNFQRLVRYNINRIGSSKSHIWIGANYKFIVFLTIFSILVSIIIFILGLKLNLLFVLLPVGIISVWYVIDLRILGLKIPSLRVIPYIKIILISIVWSIVTAIFTILNNGQVSAILNLDVILIFLQRMFFVFAITLPFDIRDMEYDKKRDLKTIPLFFGIEKAKIIAQGALLGFSGLVILQYVTGSKLEPEEAIALVVSAAVSSFIIYKTHENQKEYFYSFIMDGTMILQFLLVLATGNIEAFAYNA